MSRKHRSRNKFAPGNKQLSKYLPEVFKRKKLAASMRPRVMMHRHLDYSTPSSFKLLHHFNANHTTLTREPRVEEQ
jgi:hypothetical protein